MTNNYEKLKTRKEEIRKKLSSIVLKPGIETSSCWVVGNTLKVSGTTIKNYLSGKIADGYLAEAIYSEFQKQKHLE